MKKKKTELPKEQVTIFGESSDKWESKKNKGERNCLFGFLLLAAGILLILNNLGVIPFSVWDNIWRFWPLLFILWGVKIIFGRIFSDLVGLILILVVVLFAVSRVRPEIMLNLPPFFTGLFNIMEGVRP